MIHIITPFSHPENLQFYLDNLKDKNVIWHPIFEASEFALKFIDSLDMDLGEYKPWGWIKPWVLGGITKDWFPNVDKCNNFIKNYSIIEDNDRYLFMNDDDWFEDNVFEQFKEENDPEDDVCFISMKRGFGQQPGYPNGHGTFTLMVDLDRVIVGNIGFEQMCVKGRVLKQMEFENHGCFDGLMAMKLHEQYKVKPLYEVYALFNYLEKGRWGIDK